MATHTRMLTMSSLLFAYHRVSALAAVIGDGGRRHHIPWGNIPKAPPGKVPWGDPPRGENAPGDPPKEFPQGGSVRGRAVTGTGVIQSCWQKEELRPFLGLVVEIGLPGETPPQIPTAGFPTGIIENGWQEEELVVPRVLFVGRGGRGGR